MLCTAAPHTSPGSMTTRMPPSPHPKQGCPTQPSLLPLHSPASGFRPLADVRVLSQVEAGEEGRLAFEREIRQIFGLRDEVSLQTFLQTQQNRRSVDNLPHPHIWSIQSPRSAFPTASVTWAPNFKTWSRCHPPPLHLYSSVRSSGPPTCTSLSRWLPRCRSRSV